MRLAARRLPRQEGPRGDRVACKLNYRGQSALPSSFHFATLTIQPGPRTTRKQLQSALDRICTGMYPPLGRITMHSQPAVSHLDFSMSTSESAVQTQLEAVIDFGSDMAQTEPCMLEFAMMVQSAHATLFSCGHLRGYQTYQCRRNGCLTPRSFVAERTH